MMVVPLKGYPGVDMRRLKVQGQISGGTTFIELDDVEVPVENLIGEEGLGMRYIMVSYGNRYWLRPTINEVCRPTSTTKESPSASLQHDKQEWH
jgi:hypothetical protein